MSTGDSSELVQAPEAQAAEAPAAAQPRLRRSALLGGAQSLAATLVIALFVITFSVQAFQIPSESMEKTLLTGDYLLVDKVLYGSSALGGALPYREVERGDVIVFRPPHMPEQHFVKRVIGLPGDRIQMRDRRVWVNGALLEEGYAVYTRDAAYGGGSEAGMDETGRRRMRRQLRMGELEVPAGQYFVLGDNRDHSLDSRYWGFVPRENIVGRPLLIYFSMERAGGITPASAATDAALTRLGHALTQAIGSARWERTFQLVR
jgi:signal peptidase I